MQALVKMRTRPCSFAQAIAEREDGAQDRNDTLARMFLLNPDNAGLGNLLLRCTDLRQGEPLMPPGACVPLLP